MKKYLFLFLFLLIKVISLQAQNRLSCGFPNSCYSQNINLNTGFNMLTESLDAPTSITGNWTLVQVPTQSGITLPAPVWAINPYSSWDVFPHSSWISPFRAGLSELNNPSPSMPYVFEKCFCVCATDSVSIAFNLMADDQAIVFLDGVQITPTPNVNDFQFVISNSIVHKSTYWLTQGQHCLRVQLRNLKGTAVGFSMAGEIIARSETDLIKNACCNTTGKICGTILKDPRPQECTGIANPATDQTLGGWVVRLMNSAGGQIAVATSDALGNYCFTGLVQGSYTVAQVVQAGWIQSFPNGGSSQTVNVSASGSATANFVNCKPAGQICGTIFKDSAIAGNCVGRPNSIMNETLTGWIVFLKDALGNNIAVATSDAAGKYCFKDLLPGQYTISQIMLTGWRQSFPAGGASQTVNVVAFGSAIANFVNCKLKAKICGKKLLDVECIGISEGDDNLGLSGWSIVLFDKSGIPIDTQVTDNNGNYCFNDLDANLGYQLAEINQPGWTQSFPSTTFHTIDDLDQDQLNINFANCPSTTDPCDFDVDIDVETFSCSRTFSLVVNNNSFNLPITSIIWSFGDGFASSGSSTITHSYFPGTYNLCVQVMFESNDTICRKEICKTIIVTGPCQFLGNGGGGEVIDDGLGMGSLSQNIPNPFAETSTIHYSLPDNCKKANIIIKDENGLSVRKYELNTKIKQDKLVIDGRDLSKKGRYYYVLEVDDKIIAIKSLIKE